MPAREKLCAAALEPNVFYEPWMLLPALKAFGAGHDFHFALIVSGDEVAVPAPPLSGADRVVPSFWQKPCSKTTGNERIRDYPHSPRGGFRLPGLARS